MNLFRVFSKSGYLTLTLNMFNDKSSNKKSNHTSDLLDVERMRRVIQVHSSMLNTHRKLKSDEGKYVRHVSHNKVSEVTCVEH